MITLLIKNKWYVGLMLVILLLVLLMNISINSDTSKFAQKKPVNVTSDVIHNDLVDIILEDKAPGAIAAIISSAGILDIASAGVRKVGSDVPFTCDNVVHLGSCTKAMTAAMLATLVADGKLSWEMKLTDAIPELKDIIHTDYKNITLWQLLTHRAGLPKNPIDWSAHTDKEIIERRLAILKDNLVSAASHKIDELHYSNFGYMIAACMAEKITGMSWEVLMKQRLFEPLGMTTAGFGDPNKNDRIDQPWGHNRFWNDWSSSDDYYAESLAPAGEVYCSLEDWAKFLSIYLNSENTFLDSIYLNKLIEPVGSYAGGWIVANESDEPWAQGTALMHMGSNGIWFSSVMVAPNQNRAYIVATNSCDWGFTAEVCHDMLKKLTRIDLEKNKE